MADRFDEMVAKLYTAMPDHRIFLRDADIATALRAEREAGFAAGEKLGLERAAARLQQHAEESRKASRDRRSAGRIRQANNAAADADKAEMLAAAIRSLPLTPKE